jgi:hypothetical protein
MDCGIVPAMRFSTFISGELGQHERPCWEPLELLLGSDELCGHFMWMCEVDLEDRTVLHIYKHRWTRACLHLAGDGATYYYAGAKRYRRIDPYDLVTAVFAGWECMKPTTSERSALRAALERVQRER